MFLLHGYTKSQDPAKLHATLFVVFVSTAAAIWQRVHWAVEWQYGKWQGSWQCCLLSAASEIFKRFSPNRMKRQCGETLCGGTRMLITTVSLGRRPLISQYLCDTTPDAWPLDSSWTPAAQSGQQEAPSAARRAAETPVSLERLPLTDLQGRETPSAIGSHFQFFSFLQFCLV